MCHGVTPAPPLTLEDVALAEQVVGGGDGASAHSKRCGQRPLRGKMRVHPSKPQRLGDCLGKGAVECTTISIPVTEHERDVGGAIPHGHRQRLANWLSTPAGPDGMIRA